jgi:exonuclease III
MTDREAMLVIYLIDLEGIFKNNKEDIACLKELKEKISDLSTPLIGYAIGIPPVTGAITGTYLQSRFHLEEKDEEPSVDDSELDEILEE